MTDEVPNYPPGPRGPEDAEPGPRLWMSVEQLRAVLDVVNRTAGAASVEIEDRGACYFDVWVLDAEGAAVADVPIFPHGNAGR